MSRLLREKTTDHDSRAIRFAGDTPSNLEQIITGCSESGGWHTRPTQE